ncbi:NAD(P)/FAD-dependent oxidoreductase [Pseudomonas matsuisoli]|uniref:Amino acid oxidoreductase n=1 Tax=Pseudomonas matsuisoli TaxID=1515666 RepID=A0A917PHW2_9PSED|nr:FAD-dependent oxidoreductase [Pseudomonas matsuisoli]GGJ78720.1 amino acid oxidoreductase [Pseudomonas matsuisoli]
MKYEVIVLGAGMIGVSTALQLIKRGHAVTLVDRRPPGLETSYGNAGIIQREAVEPYPFPRDFSLLFKVMRKGGIDVNYHLDALPRIAPKLLRYWWYSSPPRYREIALAWSRLIEHSISEHAPLIEEAGANDLIRKDGWRVGFRTPLAFELAQREAERESLEYGIKHTVLDSSALAAAEPGLVRAMAGAIHWVEPWTVRSPGTLVERYAALFQRLGGRFLQGDADSLQQVGAGWSVKTDDGDVLAEHAVIALGPWSSQITDRLDYQLPLFVKRGYHRHYRAAKTLTMPLLDAENGVMLAPMNAGLRLTTGAEFAALGAPATPLQLRKAERAVGELIDLGEPVEQKPWLGARPCVVDMKPVIGAAPRHRGLWFHFGHAHQGFTLGPASGRLLAEMINGESPYIDPTPYSPTRFIRS